jgi:hypothetical protein
MKNKESKIHTFRFTPSFFEECIVLLWGGSFREMCELIEKNDNIEKGSLDKIKEVDDAEGLTFQDTNNKRNIYILLQNAPSKDRGVFLHELMHSIVFVVDWTGVSLTDSNGEWFAYWVQYYINQLSSHKLF